MKTKIYGIWILFLTPAILAACEALEYDAPEDQPLYFEYHYVNHAWGFQEYGWLIDREGNIRRFDKPEDYIQGVPGAYLKREDLEHNLALTDSIIGNVNQAELEKYINYIPGAAGGKISKFTSVAADAGASVLSCYMYDPKEDAYQYIFLAQSGDWEQFNLSEEAEKIVKWLLDFDVFWLSD